jgi:putative membrane protein
MPHSKLRISIFTIWLFHVVGAIGIKLGFYDFFLPKSWLTLVLSSSLLLLNSRYTNNAYLLLVVFLGFTAEVIGVATGAVFGSYSYGENLGFKAVGVPLVIGLNWLMLAILARTAALSFCDNLYYRILFSALIMVALDLLIEPFDPKFDYWTFQGGHPGWQNYLGWFLVALHLQYILEKSRIEPNRKFAWNLLGAQILFFLTFWYV